MISIIAAIGKNRELGKDNKLLWHLPEDLKRFKELTNGHPIIMGRKTFESIGRVLPNRTNIIITRNQQIAIHSACSGQVSKLYEGAVVVSSLEEALDEAQKSIQYTVSSIKNKKEKILNTEYSIPNTYEHEVFIIGGGQIFAQAMPLAERLYLTIIDNEYPDADVYFPEYSMFAKVISKEDHHIEEAFSYSYVTLEK